MLLSQELMLPCPEKPSMIMLDVDFAYSVSGNMLPSWTLSSRGESISYGHHDLSDILPAVYIGHDRSLHAERYALLYRDSHYNSQLNFCIRMYADEGSLGHKLPVSLSHQSVVALGHQLALFLDHHLAFLHCHCHGLGFGTASFC